MSFYNKSLPWQCKVFNNCMKSFYLTTKFKIRNSFYEAIKTCTAILLFVLNMFLFSFSNPKEQSNVYKPQKKELKIAYFASGCFWCVEAIFESVEGVEEAVSGYAGGFTKNPTYRSIGTGRTGHSETVAVYYNPKKVSFETLVKVFFGSHDPTTINGQHPDYGSQYRSIAFYQTKEEKESIDAFIKELNATITKVK